MLILHDLKLALAVNFEKRFFFGKYGSLTNFHRLNNECDWGA